MNLSGWCFTTRTASSIWTMLNSRLLASRWNSCWWSVTRTLRIWQITHAMSVGNSQKFTRKLRKKLWCRIMSTIISFLSTSMQFRTKVRTLCRCPADTWDSPTSATVSYGCYLACYFNSYLQALYMTKNFRSMMEDIDSQALPTSKQPSAVLGELFH